MTKVKVTAKLPDSRQIEVVAEPEMLAYVSFGDPENPENSVKLEDLEIISIEVVEA